MWRCACEAAWPDLYPECPRCHAARIGRTTADSWQCRCWRWNSPGRITCESCGALRDGSAATWAKFYLARLRRLVEVEREGKARREDPADWPMKLLSHAIWSTYRYLDGERMGETAWAIIYGTAKHGGVG